ncbi:MAG: hypothetical protein JNL08_12935 [Planctomycetes bacterium]|nr:hypothetical protein [Planctomycetota bacterium]
MNLLIDRGDARRAFLDGSIALREALVERLPEEAVFRTQWPAATLA